MTARSASMSNALRSMTARWGESYGRAQWAWLLQKYNVMPWDDVPEAMLNEIKA